MSDDENCASCRHIGDAVVHLQAGLKVKETHRLTAMRIGEVSQRSGVSAAAIRYYEAQELLSRPPRSHAGYRLYSTRVLDELAFIRRSRSLGLSLEETREILTLGRSGRRPCERFVAICEARLAEIERRLVELRTLQHHLQTAHRLASNGCSITADGFCQAIFSGVTVEEHPWPA